MATKTREATDAPAAVTETPAVETVETPARSRRGLKIGGLIAGSALAAALLFGGGVLLGVNLPGGAGDRPAFPQGQFPGGDMPPGGPQGGPQGGGGQPPQQQSDDN